MPQENYFALLVLKIFGPRPFPRLRKRMCRWCSGWSTPRQEEMAAAVVAVQASGEVRAAPLFALL